MRPEVAHQRIEFFGKRFGKAHLYLAYHAAFPLALTPDLLYRLWANFQRDIHGRVLGIPWIAVADLLLSGLCDEVGHELYEIDAPVRNLLLSRLKEDSNFGQQRINELSDLLLQYVRQQLDSHDPDVRDFAEVQQWTALAYTRPNVAARELASALSRAYQQDKTELVRIASLVETFAEPLAEFEPLLVYARGIKSFARGNLKDSVAQLCDVLEGEHQLQVAGVSLPIPEQVVRASGQVPASPQRLDEPQLDLRRFYRACNPSKPLEMGKSEDRQYYIDFSSARGSKIIESMKRTIALIAPDEPTCQLFTGHIGCGKSTELLRLKTELEQQGFHVVYFQSSQDLDMADVDITDILLSVAHQVSESLEAVKIRLKPGYFTNLFTEVVDFLQTPIDIEAEAELSIGIGKITAKTKESPKLRRRLREYLEPRTAGILESINKELLERAITELKRRGKAGLVVIVDNLDRVDIRPLPSGRTQPEYLFIDRGEQLRRLNCHVVYTIPLSLIFSNEYETLQNRLGGGISPKVLPMVSIRRRNGEEFEESMELLRQMIMVRAFPYETLDKQLELVTEVFDSPQTLDRLCRVSGGHIRNLMGLLYTCLQDEDPPFSRNHLENVIGERRRHLTSSIDEDEWNLLFQLIQNQTVRGDIQYQTLLRSMLVFEYHDQEGRWFGLNPMLEEAQQLKSWLKHPNQKT